MQFGFKSKAMMLILILVSMINADILSRRNSIAENIINRKFDTVLPDIDSTLIYGRRLNINPFTCYELITLKLMTGDYPFLLNVDTLRYLISNKYRMKVSVQRDALNLNIEEIFNDFSRSELFDENLKSQNNSTRQFIKMLSMKLDSTSQEELNCYVEDNIESIDDTSLYNFIIEEIWFKTEPSDISWGMDLGGGGIKFVQGAERIINDTGFMNLGFFFKKKPLYAEWEMLIINTTSKTDIEQNGYIFPKEAGPQILQHNLCLGYSYDKLKKLVIIPYIGMSINSFGIAEVPKEEYEITKNMKGEHFGFTTGVIWDIAVLPDTRTGYGEPTNIGLRLRTSYNTLKENKIAGLDGGDFCWSIQFYMNMFRYQKAKYKG
ncbi:MAG: hypothetical protein V1681_11765 [Candidatus Neomarinimicrobiota bacterium]